MNLRSILHAAAAASLLAGLPALSAQPVLAQASSGPEASADFVQEQVTYDSAPGVRLAATLTLPQGKGPFPAVVLVAGSGPSTRSQRIGGQEEIARDLARHGVAALRYDKRGLGASTGSFDRATTYDLADDAGAGVKFLRSDPRVNPAKVGVVGHSEGGLIGPIVASRDPKLGFLVMIAGPAVSGTAILMEQGRLSTQALKIDPARSEEAAKLRLQMLDIIKTEKDPKAAEPKLAAVNAELTKVLGVPDRRVGQMINAINTDWGRFFLTYDPAVTLTKVKCPVLALNGSNDVQVPPDQNLPIVMGALRFNPDVTIQELPGLGHDLLRGGGFGPKPGDTVSIDTEALSAVTAWVVKHTSG